MLISDDSDAAEPTFTLSPDDRHVACISSDMRHVVLDGQSQPTFDRILAPLCFSTDGAHLAYVATSGARAAVVLDGIVTRSYDGIDADRPVFSPDGKHVAYGAADADTSRVYLDGVPGPSRRSIGLGHPVFSPASRRLAYIAQASGRLVLAVDGQDLTDDRWKGFDATTLRFSPDSQRIGFVARVDPPDGLSFTLREHEPTFHRSTRNSGPSPTVSRTVPIQRWATE